MCRKVYIVIIHTYNMNALQKRQAQINVIKNTLIKAHQESKEIDVEALLLHICAEYGCTKIKAKELYDIAKAMI